jgi:L-amino acid N-acyltransferase YncA
VTAVPAPDLVVRPVESGDADRLRTFFSTVPEEDRTFFREDVLAPGTTERWASDERATRLVALDGDAVAAYAAVLPGLEWSRHVGEIRLVVGPEHRRRGLGRTMARAAVTEAVGMGLTKLVVEVVADQDATVAMFAAMGFEAEGLLREHVRSRTGEVRDLLVLAHFVDALWSTMHATGIDDAIAPDHP